MGKGGPKKPRGKMSSYAFSMKICREEHKKKHLDASVNCSEFSKKCSERWKNTSANEKGKSEDTAKADKARYEREMKTYIPPKGETEKKFQGPQCTKVAKLKKYEKDISAYRDKGKPDAAKRGVAKAEKSKKKKKEEDDEDIKRKGEEVEDKDEEEDDDDE
ncbi:High mobility group protein B1 [Lemmus lemmus]